MKRLAFLTALAMLVTPIASASEPQSRTYWHAETSGSPVATEVGSWVDVEGRSVRLEFKGGHLLGAGTTFEASWLSPYTTHGRTARFDGGWELENYNQLGDDIKIHSKFRFRQRGHDWSEWMGMGNTFKPGTNYSGSGMGFWSGDRRQFRFEWRLSGEIKAPTYLAGSAELSVN